MNPCLVFSPTISRAPKSFGTNCERERVRWRARWSRMRARWSRRRLKERLNEAKERWRWIERRI